MNIQTNETPVEQQDEQTPGGTPVPNTDSGEPEVTDGDGGGEAASES